MEWVKTTAKTVPQAIELALDNLGVDESEAEIVVIEEPRAGFFGRMKGTARVEARIKPVSVRPKADRRNRRGDRKGKRGNGRQRSDKRNDRGGRNRGGNNKGGGNGRNSGRDDSKNQGGDRNRGESKKQGGDRQRNQGDGRSRNRSNNRSNGENNGRQRSGKGNAPAKESAAASGGDPQEVANAQTLTGAGSNATSTDSSVANGRNTGRDGSNSGSSGKRRRGGRGKGGGEAAAAAAMTANGAGDDSRKSQNRNRNRSNTGSKPPTEETPVEHVDDEVVADHLKNFMGGLATAFGVDGAVNVDTPEPEVMIASVDGQHGLMVGPKGRTLDAIQELARISTQRAAPSAIRIRVDVGGYREQRAAAIGEFAQKAADKAVDNGVEVKLDPMPPGDRKSVHDALTEDSRVETRSIGTEPRRRVLIVPVAADDSEEE